MQPSRRAAAAAGGGGSGGSGGRCTHRAATATQQDVGEYLLPSSHFGCGATLLLLDLITEMGGGHSQAFG